MVGPYQLQSGKTSYFFVGGTSMASAHVTGIAALMLEKDSSLSQGAIEAHWRPARFRRPPAATVSGPSGPPQEICWGADATGSGLATAAAALAAVP